MGTTLAEKVWADHLVRKGSDGAPDLLYIDLMLMHEVTSPQAFEGLRLAGRKPRHVDQLIATEDHNTPTGDIDRPNPDETSALQLSTLEKNCKDFGVRLCPLGDADQGVVHAFAPVLGLTQPGMTIVCGDSHTSTHGAFGAMAIGIGTSEVEHVMATQTLSLKPFKTMAVNIEGDLPKGVTAKDIILAIIAKIGTGGGQGHVIEYRGEAIKKLSMDARMTICNMSIEAGARHTNHCNLDNIRRSSLYRGVHCRTLAKTPCHKVRGSKLWNRASPSKHRDRIAVFLRIFHRSV